MSAASPSKSRRQNPGPGCFTVLALLAFLCAGLLIFAEFFFEPLRDAVKSLRWDRVPCTILSSRFVETAWKVSTPGRSAEALPSGLYKAEITFKYNYLGKVYTSSRIWFIKPDRETRQDIEELVNHYRATTVHRCYVDPADPMSAVLERGFKPVLLIAVVPVAMIATSVAGLMSILLRRMRPPRPIREDFRYCPTLRPVRNRRPLVLRPTRRGPGLATAFLLAVGWNFTLFFLIREVVSDWMDGFPGCHGLTLTGFTAILAVVGIVFAVLPVLLLLRRIGPRPVVTIESLKVESGREARFSWRLSGLRLWLIRLTVTLEGREEATYLRDDTALTDREVFFIRTLLSASRSTQARAGTLQAAPPANLPPTFASPHNAIIWVVRFHQELAFWPDVDDEFELTVLPVGGGKANA